VPVPARLLWLLLSSLLLALIAPCGAAAQPSQDARTDWAATYTADGFANVAGGIERGAAALDNLDLTVTVDLDALGWVPRTDLFVYGLGNQGGSISEHVGDVQGIDNIETVNAWRVYEAFVQYRTPGGRVSLLGGLYDVNSEFDVLQSAQLFINSSFGIGAAFALSRDSGPSIFPFTSLGGRVRAVPHPNWYVQAAVLDGRPSAPGDSRGDPFQFGANDGVLVVAETGWSPPTSGAAATSPEALRHRQVSRLRAPSHRAHVGAGFWYYSARFDRLAPLPSDPASTLRGNRGAYVLGEWRIYTETDPATGACHVFGQAGLADDRVNRIAAYTGAGLVYTGMLAGRPNDAMGLGLAVAHNGGTYKRQQRRRGRSVDAAEWTGELTYAAALTAWLTLQGNVQYVRHPGTRPARDDALALGLRAQVTL
jgi:porin